MQEFKEQCDLKTSGEGLVGKLVSAGVEGAKCDELDFILEGNIVSQIADNIYKFKDSTGSINV